MKVILCGYHWSGCKALASLVSQGHELFVFTHDAPFHVPSVVETCRKMGIPYSTQDISEARLPFAPDVVCSIYYRYIIKKHIIEGCQGRIFNLHPSLLPKYRGCSSLTWAMIDGEAEAGFSYHYIDEGCDTGPILLQRRVPIEMWDTQQSLYMRVMFESMACFEEAFDMVAAGTPGIPQSGDASFHSRQCPHDGNIDPAWSPERIERFIRAMNYPPYPPARIDGREVRTVDEYHDVAKRTR